jgi:hypothetical protein
VPLVGESGQLMLERLVVHSGQARFLRIRCDEAGRRFLLGSVIGLS